MLEIGTASPLKTWRLLEEPAIQTIIRAELIDDHRRKYLDYEGPVSGDRGTVTRFDDGRYELLSQHHDRGLTLKFEGRVLNGVAELVPVEEGWELRPGTSRRSPVAGDSAAARPADGQRPSTGG